MRTKNLTILVVITVAVAAFILLYERHQPTSGEIAEKAERVLPDMDRDAARTIELFRGSETVRLEMQEDAWHIVEPIDFPADPADVNSLLGALEQLDIDRRLEPAEVDLGEYGLSEPSLAVAITNDEGKRSHIAIGEQLPLGSKRAIQVDSDRVLVVSGYFSDNVSKDLDEWRSTNLVTFTPGDIASFELATPHGHLHAVQIDESWSLLEPVRDLADRDQMRNIVSDLNAISIAEFIDEPPGDDSLGLANPRYRLTVLPGADKAPVVLEMGTTRTVDDATQVACRRDSKHTFWITDRAETGLGKALIRWRAQTVYHFDSWNCDSLEIITDAGHVELERVDGMWQFADGSEADNSEALNRVSKLSKLQAIDFDLVALSPGELGKAILEVSGAKDEEPKSLEFTFFKPIAEGGNVGVKVSGRETIMSVDPAEATAILDALDSLRPAQMPDQAQEDEAAGPAD